MVGKGAKLLLPLIGLVVLLQSSCADGAAPEPGPGNQANDRISITNDAATLATRVTYYDEDVPIDGSGVGYPAPSSSALSLSVQAAPGVQAAPPTQRTLRLRAEVAPPSIGGQVLQATSVAIVGNRAVVGYNMRGEPHLGAVDVFDISNRNRPVLRSQALFQDADINSVSTFGQLVFAAEATGDPAFQSPAVFEVMYLQGNNLILDGNYRWALSSFAGTSAMASGTKAYATSGDNGALFAIDLSSAPVSVDLHDARWVDVAGGKVVVVQGTPGQLSVFDEATFAPLGTFPFTGADVAESKSTVELAGGKAFIAAGSGGVQVLSATTGTVVGSVPRPDPAALGLDPSVVVTNAASVEGDLLFISNGEAGVYVAQGSQVFSTTGSEAQQTITMVGRLRFGNLQSVNHVAFRNGNLIIAAGLGGLKIVQVN